MGITISSKRVSADMGYGGFNRFREIVSSKISDEFHKHYSELSSSFVMCLSGKNREQYFKEYNEKTTGFIENKVITDEVANFLFQADCGGKIDRKQTKEIYNLIKNCDDNIIFGYQGRSDCAKMSDMKRIFSDKTKIEWC